MYNNPFSIFIQVAECGSFSKAAEKLFVTTASVMKQINKLETNLDIKLFIRTSRGVSLTDAGKSLYEDIKIILQKTDEAVAKARKIAGAKQYVLRVGTSLLNPCKPIMDLWNDIDNANSQYKIKIVPFEFNHMNVLNIIENIGKSFDLIVATYGSALWADRCKSYMLGKVKVCCAVPRKHRLAAKKKLTITDLFNERLMMVKRGDTAGIDEIRDLLEKNYPQIEIIDTPFFYDIDVFNMCVEKNNLLLSIGSWQDIHPGLVNIPIDWNYTLPYGLLYAKNPSAETKAFIEMIKNVRKK